MLVNELASQQTDAAVDEGMPASRKDPAPDTSESPAGLDLHCRKKKSVEEQRAEQEAAKKAAESDVDDREDYTEEDDGAEDDDEEEATLAVPGTHPETSPEPKGLPFTLVFSCAAWHTRAPPITTSVCAFCPMSTTLLPPIPTCHPGKVKGKAMGDEAGFGKGTTCAVAHCTALPPPAVLLKFTSCFVIAMSRYKFTSCFVIVMSQFTSCCVL